MDEKLEAIVNEDIIHIVIFSILLKVYDLSHLSLLSLRYHLHSFSIHQFFILLYLFFSFDL